MNLANALKLRAAIHARVRQNSLTTAKCPGASCRS